MGDIRSPGLLYLKGALFLALGVLASAILVWENPSLRFAFLLAVAVWGFARAYYFAFYVVEHYLDPGHRYAGLVAFLQDLRRRKRTGEVHEKRMGGDT